MYCDGTVVKTVILDLDGTLALGIESGHRGPHEYEKVLDDPLNEPVAEVARLLGTKFNIVYITGRPASCWEDTFKWIEKNKLPKGKLYMRATGDNREDSIVKKEIYDSLNLDILLVIDDRQRVVSMWREQGLIVLQANKGDF